MTLTSVLAANMGADLASSAAYAACEDLRPDLIVCVGNYAGVRALKPVLDSVSAENEVEAMLRGAWYMEVEADQGKRVMKNALREYRGAELFRLVMANHLMWRVFWHHWQLKSRNIFVDVARSTLKGVGLISGKEHEKRVLAGHRADPAKRG